MSEYNISIALRGKTAVYLAGPDEIVSDNNDYTVTLEPDGEWAGYAAKTVVYVFDNGTAVLHPIYGNVDTVPIIQTSGRVQIGVTAGELRTTKAAALPIRPSVRRLAGVQVPDPEPDVYDRIMEMIANINTGGGGSGGGVNFTPGNALELTPDGTLNVKTTGAMEADNTLYWRENTYQVEYYFATKNEENEEAIEEALLRDGYLFEKSEDVPIEDEDIFVIYYDVTKGANHG